MSPAPADFGRTARITVIGWDGAPLSAAAQAALDEATLVVGGARHLDALGLRNALVDDGRATITLGPLAPALAALCEHTGPAVVLASGDPGFFGVLRALTDAGLEPARVLPAPSSVATAFARVGIAWDDALVVSAHGSGDGRELRRAANVCRAHPKVAVLTGPGAEPHRLARDLLAGELGIERVLVVAQRLTSAGSIINRPNELNQTSQSQNPSSWGSGPVILSRAGDGGLSEVGAAERVEFLTLDEAAAREDFAEPNVVLCLDPSRVRVNGLGASGVHSALPATLALTSGAPSPSRPTTKRWLAGWPGQAAEWALAESAFEHRDGQITKAEVRALVLSRLAPRVGDLVWDVGAGSGSVGIECARFGAAVVAVEQERDSCARIRVNASAHGVAVAVLRGRAPGVLSQLPRPDAVFVGGGGVDVVRAVLERAPERIVVALASVERVGEVVRSLESDGRAVGGVLSQSSRLVPLPDGTHRFAALNPVYVVWGCAA